jgi:predicted HTH transcriptional regulator
MMCRKIENLKQLFSKHTFTLYTAGKMLPPFPSDEELQHLDHFPYPEGYQYEYKENLIGTEKLVSTICALLNHKGGYIVIGVRDVDRCILGLPKAANEKKVDGFLLICDNIFHQNLIIEEDGTPLNVENVRIRRVTSGGRRLIILEVDPKPNTKYQSSDGSRWIRVSASNYRVSTARLLREPDVARQLYAQQRKIQEEYKDLLDGFSEDLRRGMEKMEQLEADLKWTQKMLFEKILADKAAAEECVAKETQSRGFLLNCLRFLC